VHTAKKQLKAAMDVGVLACQARIKQKQKQKGCIEMKTSPKLAI
jgi:hypothetical protein